MTTLQTNDTAAREIIFVDSRVKDADTLLKGFPPGAQVVYLDAGKDGLAQMAAALGERGDVGAVHVLAHGSEGQLWLGTTFLDSGNLAGHGDALAAIGRGITADGDLLVYACNLAQGEAGAQFVASLAALTGADVAASDDRTGAGGDWELEVTTGQVEAASGVTAEAAAAYDHALATITVTTGTDAGAGSLRQAIADANNGDTITFNAAMTVGLTTKAGGDSLLIIGKNLTIDGDLDNNGTADVTIDGQYNGRVLEITTGITATLDGLVITHGSLSGAGGHGGTISTNGGSALGAGIANAGTLTINNTSVTANGAGGGGGGAGVTNVYVGGGGGGGGPLINGASQGVGGRGGDAGPGTGNYAGSAGVSGAGGMGGGHDGVTMGGKGGATAGGAGGVGSFNYSTGGAGATATSGTLKVSGGGGGSGWDAIGKAGGMGVGGIYNAATGTITVIGTSAITNNVGAGGGGGGGSGTASNDENGGAGGLGVGGVYNLGTFKITTANFGIMSNNVGVSGSGGLEDGAGSTGTVPAAVTHLGGTGTTDTAYVPPPTLTSATYDAATGALTVTGTNMTAGDTIAVNKLALIGEGNTAHFLTSGNVTASSATTFSVTLNATDQAAVNLILNKNGTASTGGTTFNLVAADDWDANVTAGNTADAANPVTVSNVAVPTITSAIYNAATGVLLVTGTGFLKLDGATNDIDVSKLTFVGEGGAPRPLTTSSVEITSGTSFTVTLNAADLAAVNQIANKNGTTSTGATTYNLAAAEDWAAGADTAVVVADLTGNGITVSNVAVPTITSAIYNAATGVLTVTGTGFLKLNGATNDIDVSKLSFLGEGSSSHALTSTNVEITNSTTFSVALNAPDKAAINQIANKNGTTSTGATTYNLAAAEDWAAGANTAVVVADLTGNGITVSNVAVPTITNATYDASNGTLVVTGTGFLKLNGATNDIDVSKLTITGQGGAPYPLTTSSVEITSDTQFTVVLSGTDQAGLRTLVNANGTQSSGGTTYNLAAGEDWAAGADAAVVIADLLGNGITVSNVVSPTLTSATYDAATGTLLVTATGMLAGDAIDATKLTLTGQGGSFALTADTANTTATSATAFTLTLGAADKLAVNGILNNNGTAAANATVFNLAGATGWNSTVNAPADTTGNGITVSNVAAPTITSATYDGATGTLVVTGNGLVKTVGATNDITVSKLTITGEGGSHLLSTTADVEVTSATSFTLTLSGADIAAVNALLNKNGTSSAGNAVYNIAAADDWNSAITGASIADLTGNAITVSNAAPGIQSATYNASTGVLTVAALNIATNDTIDVSKLSVAGQGGGSYGLTTFNVTATSATEFSVTLNAADKLAVNGLLNNNGTSAADTTVFNLAAAASWNTTRASGADTTGNGVTVSAVAAPTITSATFDGATNTLVVTGTGLVKTVGATNDITVNKLTITGEGGSHLLSTTADVEVISATSFTLTLAGADIAAVNALLNKNGTSSASNAVYNIAAADDWNSAITGASIADLTGNAITVSNAAPGIQSASYNASTGVLTVTALNIATNDTIDVSKLSVAGQGGGSYGLTTSNVTATSATEFSVTLNAADKLAVNGILNNNGTAAADTTVFNLAAGASWNTTRASGADATGNAVTVSNVVAPTITSATYDATTHILTVTGTGLVGTLGATNDITVNKLTITGEGGSRALSTTGNVEVIDATSFAVTLSGADIAAVEALFNKNGTSSTGSTAYNLAAADDWNSAVTGASIADATSPITVSNVPAPAITSATYDVATGALVVTGTGFSGRAGAANDILATKFSLTGEGGATHVLTASTANAEITSATSFTLILGANDQAAVRAITNKNGPSSTSGTTYNLAADEDWAAGADAALAIMDATNAVTVSSVAVPTVTSATYNVGTGVLVVTGTGLLGKAGALNDIAANKLTFTGKAGGTHLLASTTDVEITSATSFTLTLGATDKTAVNLLLDKEGTSSTDSTVYNIAFAEDWNTGADAGVVIADLAGNAVTVGGFPSEGGGTPPSTGTVDGVPITTEPGPGGSTVITIPVVVPTRPDTPGTSTPLADIPLVTGTGGQPIVSVSVPTGVGLQAEGLTTTTTGSAALAELGFRIERIAGDNPELTNAGQVFYATLAPNEPLSVQILKPTLGPSYDGSQPLVINGSTNPADGKQAVIVDARSLPSGTTIQVDNIEFIAVVGNVRLIGGAGQNVASGDGGAQYIVLGPDDDVIHGGGGNDTVGSEAGDDQVYGDAGDDIVFGGAGNDLLSGGTGSDRLNGGTGFDVAIQEGARTDYTVTLDGAGIKLTHTASGVSDWLVDVEQVRFATGPSLTVAHSAAEEAAAYLFQKWLGRDLSQGEGAIIQTVTGWSAEQVATAFAQIFPSQAAGKTTAQLLEGMAAAGAIRVDAIREVTVTGDAGNNTITPTLGLARYVDGGAGIDTVVIPATLGQTYVQHNASGSYTLQRLTDGAMLDVTNVERVTLSDTKLALDITGNGHAGEAAKLLGALAGPASLANKGVVGEVIRMLDAGASSQAIAGVGLQLLGANTPAQVAQTLWTNVVGRAGTAPELKILTGIMAGGVSAADLVVMAAHLDATAVRIDLVGLAAKGLEFA